MPLKYYTAPFIFGILMLFGIAVGTGTFSWSQTATNPAPVAAACAYNTSPPTGTTGTFILVQCNSTGQLKVAP